MATAVAPTPNHHHPKRPPLLPSDSDNAPPPRRPKARHVTSRYLSSSSSSSATPRRSQSPMISTSDATTPRAASAERMLVTSTMRSLSVSFQGEPYSVPVSKVKPPPAAGVTPVRDRENSRPADEQQQRWPGRLRGEDSGLLTRSLDYGSSMKGLRKCVGDEDGRVRVGAELRFEVGGSRERELGSRLREGGESVSSESTVSGGNGRGGPARSLPNSVWNRKIGPSKLIVGKKFQNGSPVSSPRDVRAASPRKALSSATPLRGPAPSRAGNFISDSNITPSMLSFAVDVRRAKLGENRIADAHDLRLLYNRLLQWRLANARVQNTMLVQKHTAETSLYNAWVTTSKLQHSVRSKGIELQSLRHSLKLYSILKKQEPHLETWGLLDGDLCNSVSGAIKALEASTIRLPIVSGAKADILKVQEAISSAVDVMQAMASSVCSLLVKVEQMNSLVSELSNLTTRENHLLEECKYYLSKTFIPLQVMHCSLRTQVMQVQCVAKKA